MKIEIQEYKEFIRTIKSKIQISQIKASIKVNEELLKLYWDIASMIVEKQKLASWGDGFLNNLINDLKKDFSNMKGFSLRNLKYMKQWYLFYTKGQQVVAQNNNEKWQQLVAKLFLIPWGHNLVIISKCKNIDESIYYLDNTNKNGISRSVLIHQIETNLYIREGKALTNFSQTLPAIQSDLAKEITKDPYVFDFLTLSEDYQERELENALMENMTKFLLELGAGFAFVGKQYKLNIGGDEFRIDLLFYHIKLKCYVVVELKTVDFKPEFAGKLSFYTSAVDGELKEKQDNPTIGILICKSKNDTIVEYSLKDINKPMGVSEYELTHILPDDFKSSLPSIEEIEKELEMIDE